MKPLKIGEFTAKTPIVQGGMGVGISLAGLASAVAEQGGIGVIYLQGSMPGRTLVLRSQIALKSLNALISLQDLRNSAR